MEFLLTERTEMCHGFPETRHPGRLLTLVTSISLQTDLGATAPIAQIWRLRLEIALLKFT
jgi:hypothetical protein